jgi:hypothetical protein
MGIKKLSPLTNVAVLTVAILFSYAANNINRPENLVPLVLVTVPIVQVNLQVKMAAPQREVLVVNIAKITH